MATIPIDLKLPPGSIGGVFRNHRSDNEFHIFDGNQLTTEELRTLARDMVRQGGRHHCGECLLDCPFGLNSV